MQKLIILIIGLLIFNSCLPEETFNELHNSYNTALVKKEYVITGLVSGIRVYVFELDNHEYLADPYSRYFIHSPNCKCHKEKCTSSDSSFQSSYSWY